MSERGQLLSSWDGKSICEACGALSDFLNDYCQNCEVNGNGVCTEKENEQETESGDK